MATYVYEAYTDKGVRIKNKVEAISRQELIRKLKENNMVPISVVERHQSIFNSGESKLKRNIVDINEIMKQADISAVKSEGKTKKSDTQTKINSALNITQKVTTRDLVIFTQNFYLLKKANFNNIHALSTVIESTDNPTLREIIKDILAGVEAGENMYTTMEYYLNVFPYIYVNMIKVGELSGSLTQSLQQAREYLETSSQLTAKTKKIILPNIIAFLFLIVLLVVGTVVAVPAIQGLFEQIGSTEQLPAITIGFSNFINFMLDNWTFPFVLIIITVLSLIYYIKTPKGKYNFDRFKYTMPIFGKLIYQIDFSRFIRAMTLNLENGMRIQSSLEISKNVAKNVVMLSMIETAINNSLVGMSWIEPFENAVFSSAMEVEMLKIGMQTNLTEMMNKLLELIDVEIDNSLEKIMKVLPQVMYSIVGIVLIFFVIVVLVPIIQVYMGNFLISAYL